jgi:hypothetical protein
VQQAQGRVQATMQMAGVGVNDDARLEREADVMGGRAVQLREHRRQDLTPDLRPRQRAQRQVIQAMFGAARTPVAGTAPPGTVVPTSWPALVVQRVGRAELQWRRLLPLYGAIAGHQAQVDALADETRQALIDHAGPFAPLVVGWGNFMQLANFLGSVWGGAGAYDDRATLLIDYNRIFGVQLRSPPIQANQFAGLQALLGDMAALTPADLAQVNIANLAYLLPRHAAANDAGLVLRMVASNRRTAGVPGLIAVNRLGELEDIYQSYPPGHFAGIPAWGDGNYAGPAENVQEHFMKHVCFDFQLGHMPPPPGEVAYWWNLFGFNPSLQYVHGFVAPKQWPGLDGELQAQFGAGYAANLAGLFFNPNTPGHMALFAYLVATYPDFAADIMTRHLAAYEQTALNGSVAMRTPQVHLSQGDYFISGAHGNVFIVARIENAQAGISSAYWTPNPVAKVASATQERVWAL